jgi:hypothetical protein
MENQDVSQYWPIRSDKAQEKRAEATMWKYPEFRAIWITSPDVGHVLIQVDKFGQCASEVHVVTNEEEALEMFLYWAFNVSL